MKTDYFQLLKDSANFAWKNRLLWLFGFIISLFSSNSSNINFSSQNDGPEGSFDQFSHRVEEAFKSSTFWFIFVAIVLLVIFLSIVVWYLVRVSKTSLIRAVVFEQSGKKLSIKKLWADSHKYLLQLFLFDLLWLLLLLPFVLVIIGILFLGIITFPVGFCTTLCLLIPLIVAAGVFVQFQKFLGERLVVLNKLPAWDAVKMGFTISKNRLKSLIIAWLYIFLPGCGVALLLAMPAFALLLPVFLVSLPLFMSEGTMLVGMVILVCGMGVANIVLSAIQSPFVVFKQTYWTKVLLEIMGEERSKISK